MNKKILISIIMLLTLNSVAFGLGENITFVTSLGNIIFNTNLITGTNISCNNVLVDSGDPCNPGGGGAGNPFDQSLNTSDSPTHVNMTITGNYIGNGSLLTGLPGGGDITGVNTDGPYLTGGCSSGTCDLLLNDTKLNSTIISLGGGYELNISTDSGSGTITNNEVLVISTTGTVDGSMSGNTITLDGTSHTVNTDTQLNESQVEAMIFDKDNTGNLTTTGSINASAMFSELITVSGNLTVNGESNFTSDVHGISITEIEDGTATSTINMDGFQLRWLFDAPIDPAFKIEGTGGWSGHGLLHVSQTTGNPGDNHVVHFEADDADVKLMHLIHTVDAASILFTVFEGNRSTPTDNDEIYNIWRLSDSVGDQTEYGRFTVVAIDVTNTTEDGVFTFDTVQDGVLTEALRVGSESNFSGNVSANTFNGNWNGSINYYLKTELNATGNTPGAILLGMDTISSPTYSTVQDMQTIFHSAGWTSGGTIVDNGDETINVSGGTGLIRPSDNRVSVISWFDWPASNNIAIPSNTTRYIGINYSGGTPSVIVKTTDSWDYNTEFFLGNVVNEEGTLHIDNDPHAVGDHANFMIQRTFQTLGLKRDEVTGGLILGETDVRKITVSAGALWQRLNRFVISAIDTNASDTFDRYYRDGSGGWIRQTGQIAWNNTVYDDDSGTLATLSNNRYSVQYFYIDISGDLMSVFGQNQYVSLAGAEAESPPSTLPDRIVVQGLLIGRIIFQKGGASAESIESVFTTVFSSSQVVEHNNLAGLGDDDHPQYLLTTGARDLTGNQSLAGFSLTDVECVVFQSGGQWCTG